MVLKGFPNGTVVSLLYREGDLNEIAPGIELYS